jgi:hypothetical protein
LLVAKLRTGSHHLRCEIDRWRVPKEVWEEGTCIFYNKDVVETKWHFDKERPAYEDIHNSYEKSLKVNNMHQLFDEDKINQIASILVKIHNKIANIEKSLNMS